MKYALPDPNIGWQLAPDLAQARRMRWTQGVGKAQRHDAQVPGWTHGLEGPAPERPPRP